MVSPLSFQHVAGQLRFQHARNRLSSSDHSADYGSGFGRGRCWAGWCAMGSGYRAYHCHRRGGHFICRAGQIETQLIVESSALIDDDTASGGVEIIDPNRRDILANPSAGDCLIANDQCRATKFVQPSLDFAIKYRRQLTLKDFQRNLASGSLNVFWGKLDANEIVRGA